uniref:UbiA family prenyltransferase n=1 Tax=Thermosphaera aggregans TaxID=54254 RepID=A0A7C2BKE6_9CREN
MARFVMKQVLAYMELTRPPAPLLIGVAVFIGQIVGLGKLPEPGLLFPPFTASVLMTASSFVVNDVIDYEIDLVNRPRAPLPSGRVSRRSALLFALSLFVACFILSLPTGLPSIIFLNSMYALSILYSLRLKEAGLLGNITVALCVTASFAYGSLTATGWFDLTVLRIA